MLSDALHRRTSASTRVPVGPVWDASEVVSRVVTPSLVVDYGTSGGQTAPDAPRRFRRSVPYRDGRGILFVFVHLISVRAAGLAHRSVAHLFGVVP